MRHLSTLVLNAPSVQLKSSEFGIRHNNNKKKKKKNNNNNNNFYTHRTRCSR